MVTVLFVQANHNAPISGMGAFSGCHARFVASLSSRARWPHCQVGQALVMYDLLHTTVSDARETMEQYRGLLARMEGKTDWQLDFSFQVT